jgi:alcohol dehydrogenase (cytochrome c)
MLLIPLGVSAAQTADRQSEIPWRTYNGDFAGQRHSPLREINKHTVGSLGLAWIYHATISGAGIGLKPAIKSTPIEQDGVLYFSAPNNVWAVDARSGREIWHFKTDSGSAIGNRGVAVSNGTVYVEVPDNHLIALDASTGKEKWRVEIADARLGYSSTTAPVLVKNHLIVAAAGDSLDLPGYLQARDPETGALQWEWRATPRPGEKGAETWPNAAAMDHGGGMPWLPGTYDPELNLIYWGTGNPSPVHAGQSRLGDDLWTCSIVALDADTGELRWYYQASPHDTHDWDAVQTPVLVDTVFAGKPRKLLMQASRNGYFFLLDRATGEHLITEPYLDVNWAKGIDANGHPIPDPEKQPKPDGVVVNPSSSGAANWPPPALDPAQHLLYVNMQDMFSIYYLMDLSANPAGFAGRDDFLAPGPEVRAIDYLTGKVRWVHKFNQGASFSGVLSTAAGLVFTGDSENDLVALDGATGQSVWHSNLGALVTNSPITYRAGGRQFLVVAAGMDIYGFAIWPGAGAR